MFIISVLILRVLVAFLLLLGTSHLCAFPVRIYRAVLASITIGFYTGCCMINGYAFLGNIVWNIVFLVLTGGICFGCSRYSIRCILLFCLMNYIIGLLVSTEKTVSGSIGGAIALFIVYFVIYMGTKGILVPVCLTYRGKMISILALRDTGNSLLDPLTGTPVLVVGAETAQQLFGLTKSQLKDPVSSIGAIPGLRLIPYQTIGQSGKFMLAIHLPEVKIGAWKGSRVVAFAPEGLGTGSKYQALTGGSI